MTQEEKDHYDKYRDYNLAILLEIQKVMDEKNSPLKEIPLLVDHIGKLINKTLLKNLKIN